jgi:hypothetical protein
MSHPLSSRLRPVLPLCLLLALVAALALPLILVTGETSYTWDEFNYYLPAIAQIRAHWPQLDLVQDSLSATAPGYAYLMAGISRIVGDGLVPLRLVNLGFSLGVVAVLWSAWPAAGDGWTRFAALLPLAGCNFFIKSASNVVTDNPTLLAMAGMLTLTLTRDSRLALPAAGALGALAVFFRQLAIWLTLPLALAVMVRRRFSQAWVLLPALAVLAALVHAWGGLVPPTWQTQHQGGLVFAAGAYQLAVIAFLAPWFGLAAHSTWRAAASDRWVWLGALGGLVLALAGPNDPSYEAGRWGGYLWNVAGHLPVMAHRSPLFLLAAPVGGALLAHLTRQLWQVAGRVTALPWLGAEIAFLLSGLTNRQVYHRYFEPTQLVLLILWLALVARAGNPALDRRPLLVLGGLQLAITLVTAHGRTFFAS